MADTATLTGWLADAEAALQQLAMGTSVVSVSYDGRTVTYTPANEARLRARIRELKQQLGQITSARRAPMGISVG